VLCILNLHNAIGNCALDVDASKDLEARSRCCAGCHVQRVAIEAYDTEGLETVVLCRVGDVVPLDWMEKSGPSV